MNPWTLGFLPLTERRERTAAEAEPTAVERAERSATSDFFSEPKWSRNGHTALGKLNILKGTIRFETQVVYLPIFRE